MIPNTKPLHALLVGVPYPNWGGDYAEENAYSDVCMRVHMQEFIQRRAQR